MLVLLGGRSETIRGLRGDGRDERFRRMEIHATAIAGPAMIGAIIVAFLVELARGHSGAPYGWLGAIAGVAYLAAMVGFRTRSRSTSAVRSCWSPDRACSGRSTREHPLVARA